MSIRGVDAGGSRVEPVTPASRPGSALERPKDESERKKLRGKNGAPGVANEPAVIVELSEEARRRLAEAEGVAPPSGNATDEEKD